VFLFRILSTGLTEPAKFFFSTCEKQKRRFAVSGRYLLENTKLAFFVSKQAAHIPRNYKAQQSGLHL
jgi:hypothetical protein